MPYRAHWDDGMRGFISYANIDQLRDAYARGGAVADATGKLVTRSPSSCPLKVYPIWEGEPIGEEGVDDEKLI